MLAGTFKTWTTLGIWKVINFPDLALSQVTATFIGQGIMISSRWIVSKNCFTNPDLIECTSTTVENTEKDAVGTKAWIVLRSYLKQKSEKARYY